jgi:predicted Zn-dependent protease
MRAPFPATTGEIVFHIRDNFGNKAPVRIDIDAENASLYPRLAHEVTARAAGRAGGATVDDALAVVGDLPEVTSAGARHFIAAGALMEAGRFAEADKALTALSTADRELYGSASIQMTAGLLSYRLNQYDTALKHFDAARSASPQQEGDRAELVSKSLTASVLLAQGKHEAADVYLKQPGVTSTILHERTFLESLKDKLGLNTSVLVQRAMATSGKM